MNDFFIWKGVNSRDMGLVVAENPLRIIPKERETTEVIPGRSGTLTVLEGESVYDDIVLAPSCWIRNESRLDEIIQWLRGTGKVTFSNRQGGYYNARIASQISLAKVVRGAPHREFTVPFRCEPFFYLDSQPIECTQSGSFLSNAGTVFSEPVMKITLTGDAEITLGTCIIQLSGITGEVTIDSHKMECYKGILPANDKMTGDFPTIPEEGAYLNWTGGVSKIEVWPNWRCL